MPRTALVGAVHGTEWFRQAFLTAIRLALPSAVLGSVTVRTPLWYLASILSLLNPAGSVTDS